MDNNRVKGKMKDVKGRVERQVGEWTGDEKLQAEGIAHQGEGKVQNAFGNAKDKVRDIADDVKDTVRPDSRPANEQHPSKDAGDRYFDKTKRSA
ncbi:MAG TPA: CsbD family protein [Terriglobales bacterium]|nr:CsbD family protein [Terriglobales bacterium]